MRKFELVIKGGTIVCHDGRHRLDLAVEDGLVVAWGENLTGAEEIDANGRLIVPGGVDPHVHLQMPTGTTRTSDDWYSGSLAALYGGTTSILDFVEPANGESLLQALNKRKAEATEKCWVNYGLHMTAASVSRDILNQILEMPAHGITSFKSYTTYDGMKLDYAEIKQVMQTVEKVGGVLMVHAEDDLLLKGARQQLVDSGRISPQWFPTSRPAEAEIEAVHQCLQLAGETGCRLYIVHVSTREAIDLIHEATRKGVSVMAETCPQYLFLNTENFLERDAISAAGLICSPALRDKPQNALLREAIQDGLVQTVGSDHCSFNLKSQKSVGLADFRLVPGGLPGIEMRYSLMYSAGVVGHQLPLEHWVNLCSTMPAKAFGLYPRKGSLEVGSDADIVIFDPHNPLKITHQTLHENVDYTPYEGYEIAGSLSRVILGGSTVILNNQLVSAGPTGEFLFCDTPRWE